MAFFVWERKKAGCRQRMCFREAESVIFRSVGPIMVEITRDLFSSPTPPLERVEITVFHQDFSSTHNIFMKNFRKSCSDLKEMLKNL